MEQIIRTGLADSPHVRKSARVAAVVRTQAEMAAAARPAAPTPALASLKQPAPVPVPSPPDLTPAVSKAVSRPTVTDMTAAS